MLSEPVRFDDMTRDMHYLVHLFAVGCLTTCIAGCTGEKPAATTPAHKPSPAATTAVSLPPGLDTELRAGIAQLGAPLEWFEIPGAAGLFHRVQRSRDGYLLLTPNECFFPRLGLTAGGEGAVPDQDKLNGGKTFAFVEDWDPGDVAEWGVWLASPGPVTLRVRMSAETAAGEFELSIGDERAGFALAATGSAEPSVVKEFTGAVKQAGRHLVRLTCTAGDASAARLHWIEVSGLAVAEGMVLRKRWRPAAAHTGFSSTAAPDGVRMWIMEMDAVPGELGFYAPITTPFGYYGPTWLADGRVNTGMNFSLWSYGRGQKEPPIGELSHLLAIGNRDAKFSGFGHEGTGVKIRDWEPLAGRQGQRQAFALRVEPGRDINTFHSYFYASDEGRWRLFGVGRQKPKRRPLTHLGVGSFVEVPGPPQRQRTGSTIRRMRYRGWVSRDGREWHALDTMKLADIDKETGLTYTHRGLDDDGWFFMQTGGWRYRQARTEDVRIGESSRDQPEYLLPERVKTLLETPSAIDVVTATRDGAKVKLTYRVRNPGTNAEAFAYFGETEGLTFAERWAGKTRLPSPREGENETTVTLANARPAKLRLFLRHDAGQFWSFTTTQIN